MAPTPSARQFSERIRKPRVLVAGTREAVRTLRGLLAEDAELIAAYSTDDALALLERRPDLVVCNVRFDESRMFDFLQAVRARSPALPIVCCRVSVTELRDSVHHAIEMALDALGIETFVDCAPLYRERGEAGAADALRRAILTRPAAPGP
jgi:response regulator RpfG family c-di-GMP phosphodiesterase